MFIAPDLVFILSFFLQPVAARNPTGFAIPRYFNSQSNIGYYPGQ